MIPSVVISLLLFGFSAQTNWQHSKYAFSKTLWKLWNIFLIHIPDGYFCFIWMSADRVGG